MAITVNIKRRGKFPKVPELDSEFDNLIKQLNSIIQQAIDLAAAPGSGSTSTQVNSDWNAVSGVAEILNKPSTFPPAAHNHVEADITDLQNYALDSDVVHDTGNETVAGIKTFSSFPVTPSSAPTSNYEVANKKYVDDNIGGYTDEQAQDAVGTILDDGGDIDFTYDDVTPKITAVVKAAVVTEAKQVLADNTTQDVSITKHGYVPKAPNDTSKFLRGDGTWDVPGAGEWTIINKTAIETIQSDNTLSDDSVLKFTTVANTKYIIEITALWATTAAADFQYNLAHGGTTTLIDYYEQRAHATGANGSGTLATYPYNTSPQNRSVVLATDSIGVLKFRIYLEVGASGGTFSFQWAQATSNASNTSIKPGSELRYKVFA